MIYPWLQDFMGRVAEQLALDKLPHALLITGAPGLGKLSLAKEIAALCLCNAPKNGVSCGLCKSCQLVEADSHSDFRYLTPAEDKKQIAVDDVRAMVEFAFGSSMQSGRKVVLIEPVEALNRNSANALLKTLEEPSKNSVLILVAERQDAVLPTIRSRCQLLSVATPSSDAAKQWLACAHPDLSELEVARYLSWAGGAPLRASSFVEMDAAALQGALLAGLSSVLKREASVSAVASQFDDELLGVRLEWLLQWCEQMILHASTGQEDAYLYHDSIKMLSYLATRARMEQLFCLRDYLLEQLALLLGNSNPNSALLCESVLLHWFSLMPRRAT